MRKHRHRIHLIFQPGEEGFHGARFMLEEGLLDPLPEAAFALHIMPNYKHGVLACRAGAMLAAADMLEIRVEGRGGHASMPHQTRDPVPVACEIVTAIQAMVTRRYEATEATVITVAQLHAGSAHNIVPDSAMLTGTIRTLSSERRKSVQEDLRRLAEGIASAHECRAEVTIPEGFPPTLNDSRAAELFERVAHGLADGTFENLATPIMGAEDFSYVLEKVPGAMAFLGVAAEGADWTQCCGIHSSRMVVDESVLPRGSAILAGCALRFLEQGWD